MGNRPETVAGAELCDVCRLLPTDGHAIPVPTDMHACVACATALLECERVGRYTSLAHTARLVFALSPREWDYLTTVDRRWYMGAVAYARLGRVGTR